MERAVGVEFGGHGVEVPLVPKFPDDVGTVYLVLGVILFPLPTELGGTPPFMSSVRVAHHVRRHLYLIILVNPLC